MLPHRWVAMGEEKSPSQMPKVNVETLMAAKEVKIAKRYDLDLGNRNPDDNFFANGRE